MEDWICPDCSGEPSHLDWAEFAHGATCCMCSVEYFEPWCESVAGNDGNGLCNDCIEIGNMSLEDRYEDQ